MLYELDITPQSARNRLAAYQFTGEDVFKPVSVLSGGELSRLRLCMLMDESINLLILDEPTNHLDIDSREWLEQAVEDFDGTLLFVSHDRYFINRFATRVWELEDRAITDYPMGFMQYRQVKRGGARRRAAAARRGSDPAEEARRRRKGNRAQQAARKQLTICETAISRLEADSCPRLDRGDGGRPPATRRSWASCTCEHQERGGPAGAGDDPLGGAEPASQRNRRTDMSDILCIYYSRTGQHPPRRQGDRRGAGRGDRGHQRRAATAAAGRAICAAAWTP